MVHQRLINIAEIGGKHPFTIFGTKTTTSFFGSAFVATTLSSFMMGLLGDLPFFLMGNASLADEALRVKYLQLLPFQL